jgi:hypothetical protein
MGASIKTSKLGVTGTAKKIEVIVHVFYVRLGGGHAILLVLVLLE